MTDLIALPCVEEIEEVPQSAVLAVAQHALAVARNSLIAEHPYLGVLGECYEGRVPPRQVMLANLVVDRCAELESLIGWYRRSCPRALTNKLVGKDDQGEDEPF